MAQPKVYEGSIVESKDGSFPEKKNKEKTGKIIEGWLLVLKLTSGEFKDFFVSRYMDAEQTPHKLYDEAKALNEGDQVCITAQADWDAYKKIFKYTKATSIELV